MLDLSLHYKTQCGYPVRNLHASGLSYEGEFFYKDCWSAGAWLDNGKPDILTSDLDLIKNLTLTEIPFSPSLPSQINLFP